MLTDRDRATLLERPNPFENLFREIAEIAQVRLRRSSHFELWDLNCDFSGGVLTLRGRVPTCHLKQIAQACVAEVPGVLVVDNRVEVVKPLVSQVLGRSHGEALTPELIDSQ